ncbi:MAG: N-acetylmuramoyl-L-alanine amidase [Spirochaetaceae bacterium]|nr:N-acetylmuramoyl-L-alanine amidase [Spirochaetaceae bacterium]
MRLRFIFLVLILIPPQIQAQTGVKSYSLDETLKELGAILNWEPFFSSGTFVRGDHRLSFQTGNPGEQGMALFDGREVLALPLPYVEKGALRFPEAFVSRVKAVFSPLPPSSPAQPPSIQPPPAQPGDLNRLRIAAIILDPGHGGKDPGAVGTPTNGKETLKSVEKDIALSTAKKLAALLTAAYPGKRVLLTRTDDTYPSLEDRVNIANTVPLKDNEAIIYISIHANASLNKNARGYEVWYLPPETQRELIDREKYADSAEVIPILNDMLQAEFISESTLIGRFIIDRFKETLGSRIPSRGLKAENWYVVRNARMPAVLVELGFVTNYDDARLMADEASLKLYAEALYKGIADFVAEFEKSGGYSAP